MAVGAAASSRTAAMQDTTASICNGGQEHRKGGGDGEGAEMGRIQFIGDDFNTCVLHSR